MIFSNKIGVGEESAVKMSVQNPHQNDIAIGALLELSKNNADARNVLMKYRHELSHSTNSKNLKTFKNSELENAANFLKLRVRDKTGDQLYPNKDVLVDRVILKVETFLENTCDACESKYCIKLDDPSEPLLACHICMQGSHDCSNMKEKVARYNKALLEGENIVLPPYGMVWLCQWCRLNHDAMFPPMVTKKICKNVEKVATNATGKTSENCVELDSEKDDPSQTLDPDSETNEISDRARETGFDIRYKNDPAATLDQKQDKENICELFLKMQCPHGLRGKQMINGHICPKYHPKLCRKYCRYGSDNKIGCTKGKNNCDFFHPTLCKNSIKTRTCFVENCKKTHLKGTIRHRIPRMGNNFNLGEHFWPALGHKAYDLSQLPMNPYPGVKNGAAQNAAMYQNRPTSSKQPNKQPFQRNSRGNPFLSEIPQLLIEIQSQQRALQAELHQMKYQNMQAPYRYQHPGHAGKQIFHTKKTKKGPDLLKK